MTRFAPLWQDQNSYPAGWDRALLGALWPSGGGDGPAPAKVAGTMNVSIPAGRVAVPMGANQGSALCRWDAAEVVTLDPAPPSGQSRWDLVTALVRDPVLDGGGSSDFVFSKVTGVAAASNPAVPAVPARSYALAQINVIGGSANLDGSTVFDRRNQPLAIPTPPLVPLHTAGNPLVGPAYGGQPLRFASVQGAVVVSGNFGTVTWSPAFPNGLLAYSMMGAQWQYPTSFVHSTATLNSVTVSAHNIVDGSMRNGTLGFVLMALGF